MKLEKYPIEKLNKQILAIMDNYLDLNDYRVFFFGSRVKGDNFPRADIDLGVDGSRTIPAKIKIEIKEDLEKIPILYKIDFVDFQNTSKRFRREALKNIEYVK